ncbi:methyltransferase family protein [Jiella pelagia]|uniref:Isoprenylcysteine carboxylmethyltransferase family protein n=2 Tax=Aurantimonadaceae TaxID=255475 RepID=A0ABY7C9J7_9HYPH|nr:isoprenylcysteine carboxylmethyltransferase family protein [Jiella pelagia]WAP71443.1 isoprenylcysteine carboxylmethyltransferase family protein [Jiella pelagia]
MLATGRTSSAVGHTAYGFGGTIRQQAAQRLFRVSIVGALFGAGGYAIGLEWAVLHPMIDVSASLRLTGLAIALLGSGLTAIAQSNMGRRWRVGVPERAPDALVTTGLFGMSRNPVFLGMLMLALGLALALPSAVIVACTVAFWLACEIQVWDEEMFLENAFGADYTAYRRSVRRWI